MAKPKPAREGIAATLGVLPAATPVSGLLTLAIDVGGTGLKASVLDGEGRMIVPRAWTATPYPCRPETLLAALLALVAPLPHYDRVSIGFPGAVRDGRVITAPHFDTKIWAGFPLRAKLEDELHRPVRLLNDAEIQGYGAISGKGLEMILTLGTGAGTGLFSDGRLTPHLELAHHPVHKDKAYNEYIGRDALKKVGPKRWNRRVVKVIGILDALVHYDMLYIGGGNAERLTAALPERTKIVSNDAGITGGIALWRDVPAGSA